MMGKFSKYLVIFNLYLLYVSYYGVQGQNIEFSSGRYNGIVIGIDGDKVPASECGNILNNLELVLNELSKNLYEATSKRAGIGRVDILIPVDWNYSNCGLHNSSSINPASTLHSYERSHFQITANHSLAVNLPWAKQYKPCKQNADSVVLPLPFIISSALTDSIRGKLMLFEWAKFRYGVFDEIGYAVEEDSLPACYTKEKQAYLSACSNIKIPAISLNESACSLEFIMRQKDSILPYLERGSGSTSIMSAPYLQQIQSHFCNESTHNPWIDTKHNLFCERRSVNEIVFDHNDFKSSQQELDEPPVPEIQILKHDRIFLPAYAFVIEDSQEMRDSFKLLHVKQAIAQYFEILGAGTEVQIIIYSEDVIISKANQLINDEIKAEMLNHIPDSNYVPIPVSNNRQLRPIMEFISNNLSGPGIYSWNVFLFSSSSENISDMSLAVETFRQTPYSISVITFDNGQESNSVEWLKWYGIQNTKNVIPLPYCPQSVFLEVCTLQTSSLIVEHLISCLNDQQYGPRFVQKAAQVELQNVGGHLARFTLNGDSTKIKNLYFLMSIPRNLTNPSEVISVIPPNFDTDGCIAEPLLHYGYVLKFLGSTCTFRNGDWTIQLKSFIPPGLINLYFDVYLEYNDYVNEDGSLPAKMLNVVPSLGVLDLTKEIVPNSVITPVYVSVTAQNENPVLDAEVSLQIYHRGLLNDGSFTTKIIVLKDNGDMSNGVDQTKNDGVYSNYLSGFSTTDSPFHLGQVRVSVNRDSKILRKIRSPNATFLNEQLTDKCCGNNIFPLETTGFLQKHDFRTFIPGFKTFEPWANARLQPGMIGSVKVSEETDTSMSIQFVSVQGDLNDGSVVVISTQACCVPGNVTESSPAVPNENDCKPDTTDMGFVVPPGSLQTVKLSKTLLVEVFAMNDEAVEFLRCRFRAVNSNSEFGRLSSGMVDINVSAITKGSAGGGRADETKCDSLSDECLPILIFWILIGVVALLVVVLIIVIICCCIRTRRKDSQKRNSPDLWKENVETPSRLGNNVSSTSTPYTKAPINTLPNSNSPNAKEEVPKVVKELFVNHAYIQDEFGEIKIIADNGEILRKPINNAVVNENVTSVETPKFRRNINPRSPTKNVIQNPSAESMQIFKPEPFPKPNSNKKHRSKQSPRWNDRNKRPEIIHANPMLRQDSSQIAASPPTRQDPSVIYASVSRAGRLKSSSHYFDGNYNFEYNAGSIPSSKPRSAGVDPHYMVPQNSLGRTTYPSRRDPIPDFRFPPQVQPYPDSDSSTDDPNGERRPPRFTKPSPYPAGSKIVGRPQSSQSTFAPDHQVVAHSGAAGLPVQPPVPPPRLDIRSVRPVNSIQRFKSRQDLSSEEDSDQWDDGDNYDHNGGVSYA